MDAGPGGDRPGGSLGRGALKLLGAAATYGIDPSRILRADPVERELLLAIIREAHQHADNRDQRLARLVVSELSQALKRGRH